MTNLLFPPLSDWAATRDTLAFYAKSIGVVPRALVEPHPKWWHISLKVEEAGAATDRIPIPGSNSESIKLLMNLRTHSVDVETSDGEIRSLSMREGLSSTDFGDQLLSVLDDLGIDGDYERAKFEDEEPREYDVKAAGLYRTILQSTSNVLELHRSRVSGEPGPVQLWPHNFDLAFEWFGSLMIPSENGGELPSQINFGLAPGDDSYTETYFYSNPWPFQESLTDVELPSGARWFIESWQGTLLPLASIAGDETAANKISDYFNAVYELAAPLLTE